jgi:BMFP domain-containing protein YqiC
MLNQQLESLAKELYNALPSGVKHVEKNIQEQFQTILHSTLSCMDIVTREEFDVQTKVLARTRQKVEALQKQIEQLLLIVPKTV